MRTSLGIICRCAAVMMIPLLILASCSKVTYSEPVIVDQSPLSFDIDWSKVVSEGEEPPQSVTVIMSRVKSMVGHYMWHVDSDGNVCSGVVSDGQPEPELPEEPELPAEPEQPADPEQPAEPGQPVEPEQPAEPELPEPSELSDQPEQPAQPEQQEMLVNGIYMVSGFACGKDDELLSNFSDFESSGDILLKDLYVEVPELTEEELIALDIQDLNPGIPFIRQTGRLYHVVEENGGVREMPAEGGVKLTFEQLTCELGFSLHLEIEEGVEVERVVGVISGLPVKAYLMSGYVDAEKTGKVCFEMTDDSGEEGKTGSCTYSGHVLSFGLTSSKESIVSIGDGVFNGFIKARYVKSEEEVYEHIFNVSFNLKKMIDASGLMSKVAKKQEIYRLDEREYVFDINTLLKITKENIMSDSEGGFEEWEEDDSKDEGLNPEV